MRNWFKALSYLKVLEVLVISCGKGASFFKEMTYKFSLPLSVLRKLKKHVHVVILAV